MVVMHPLQNQKLSGIIRQTFEELCLYETIRGRLEIKSYSVTSEYKKLRKVFVALQPKVEKLILIFGQMGRQ